MANMTYVEAINFALTVIGDTNPEATEKLNALAHQIGKRGTKTGLTKTQKVNETLKAVILDILADAEEFMYMADLMADERLTGLSPQKMGALLGQLVKADEVVKHIYKKRTMYAVKGVEFVAPDAEPAEADAQ
jgi:hypothetical protein